MAFSNGTFSRLFSWASDQSNDIKIRADRMDAEFDGMATGLSTALLKDGSQTATQRIPFAQGVKMGGQSIQLDPANTSAITASSNNVIVVSANGANQITISDGAIAPVTDNDVDLGTSSLEFKDAFFDGTVTTDGLTIGSSTTVTSVDADMAGGVSGSDDTLASAKTIKAYVDAQVDTVDTLAEVLAIGNTTTTDQKIQFRDAGIFINSSADGQLDVVADTEIQIAATTIDINGNVQLDGTLTVGVDDTGYDVKLFGATASAHLLWDASADKLLTVGGALIDIVKDKLMIGGTAVTTTAAELNLVDAIARGKILYGNASGASALLSPGVANSVLLSDGTDISWAAAGAARASLGVAVNSWSGILLLPANQTYKLVIKCPFAGVINSVTTMCASGSATATFKINTTALGGTANAISTSEQSQAHSGTNAFSVGDDIQVTISSNSSCVDASFSVVYTR